MCRYCNQYRPYILMYFVNGNIIELLFFCKLIIINVMSKCFHNYTLIMLADYLFTSLTMVI